MDIHEIRDFIWTTIQTLTEIIMDLQSKEVDKNDFDGADKRRIRELIDNLEILMEEVEE